MFVLWAILATAGHIPDAPSAEEVLPTFDPRLEEAAHHCARIAGKHIPGDVIIALRLEPDRLPRFDLDVSRTLGSGLGACLQRRFRPIIADFMHHVPIVDYIIHDLVEVVPGSPFVDLDPSAFTPATALKGRRVRLPPDIWLEPEGCLRVRGTPAFSDALERWLNRVGKRIDVRWQETIASQLGIPRRSFAGAWLHAGTSLLVWSWDEPRESWSPTHLCRVSPDRVSLPPEVLTP
jgi:hypothetical protein